MFVFFFYSFKRFSQEIPSGIWLTPKTKSQVVSTGKNKYFEQLCSFMWGSQSGIANIKLRLYIHTGPLREMCNVLSQSTSHRLPQNHRMERVGRDLWKSSSSIPVLIQIYLEQVVRAGYSQNSTDLVKCRQQEWTYFNVKFF